MTDCPMFVTQVAQLILVAHHRFTPLPIYCYYCCPMMYLGSNLDTRCPFLLPNLTLTIPRPCLPSLTMSMPSIWFTFSSLPLPSHTHYAYPCLAHCQYHRYMPFIPSLPSLASTFHYFQCHPFVCHFTSITAFAHAKTNLCHCLSLATLQCPNHLHANPCHYHFTTFTLPLPSYPCYPSIPILIHTFTLPCSCPSTIHTKTILTFHHHLFTLTLPYLHSPLPKPILHCLALLTFSAITIQPISALYLPFTSTFPFTLAQLHLLLLTIIIHLVPKLNHDGLNQTKLTLNHYQPMPSTKLFIN